MVDSLIRILHIRLSANGRQSDTQLDDEGG
jgi:hypothetical protein